MGTTPLNTLPPDVRFKHLWRSYQDRVLAELAEHLDDDRLHVVAAPGSGKTVLGLEVVRRLDRPALILAPTLAIRDQWLDRLCDLFLPDGASRPDWISADVHRPGFVTAATYQALHMALNGDDDPAPDDSEEVDEPPVDEPAVSRPPKRRGRSKQEAMNRLREHGIRTLVVDEAHHLRSEWWESLTTVHEHLEDPTTVALTATPPYDVDEQEWHRYQRLCGPVDAEISVPELVREHNLCPHQDYVYLSLPSGEEEAQLRAFRDAVTALRGELPGDGAFVTLVQQHPWIDRPPEHVEAVLSNPAFASSMAIFLTATGRDVPRKLLKILGVSRKRVPELDLEWLEILLQELLFGEPGPEEVPLLAELKQRLSRLGVIDRRRVRLHGTSRIEAMLAASITKLDSIIRIVDLERDALRDELRMVILTDFIRKSALPRGPTKAEPLNQIGVVPIFETIRRSCPEVARLAVLTGSLVIVPVAASEALNADAVQLGIDPDRLRLFPLAHDARFARVEIRGGNKHDVVRLATALLDRGEITVLVGTKSLLGEGWDAPSINTLVLASFVGSFMLSNQMRGRAMRTLAGSPGKTANIWHLVCAGEVEEGRCHDFETMERRFRSFVGISNSEPAIENGMTRLGLGPPPFSAQDVARLNDRTARLAEDRGALRRCWDDALRRGGYGAGLVEEIRVSVQALPRQLIISRSIMAMLWQALTLGSAALLAGLLVSRAVTTGWWTALAIGLGVSGTVALPRCAKAIWLLIRHGSILSSMEEIGETILRGLSYNRVIKTELSRLAVRAERGDGGEVLCSLRGGTPFEKSLYLNALQELLDPIENPRYLLVRKVRIGPAEQVDYHAVPEVLGTRKDRAQHLARTWKRLVGPVELVYTRSQAGREVLLRAREQAVAAGFQKPSERRRCWK